VFHSFQSKADARGAAVVEVTTQNSAMEWDIYQISLKCNTFIANCIAAIYLNGFFLCATPQGALDTATGPPDVVIQPGDLLTVEFTAASPNDTVSVGLWFNENPVDTTYSASH
jgi:hypothetical protein